MRRRLSVPLAAILVATSMASLPGHAQSDQRQSSFEVASVKHCGTDVEPGRRTEEGTISPDRFRVNCQTVRTLIFSAYVAFADDHFSPFASMPIEGGPSWIDSERYEINAKAASPPNHATLNGTMLRTLLEDRFRLKLHTETREVSLYALSVGKGRPHLQPFKEGSCIPIDFENPPPLPPRSTQLPLICGLGRGTTSGYDLYRATLSDLAVALSTQLDRRVVDRTGISGMFNFHLDLTPADLGVPISSAPESTTARPEPADVLDLVRRALDKLGLNLSSTKGMGKLLVIDHVERPTSD